MRLENTSKKLRVDTAACTTSRFRNPDLASAEFSNVNLANSVFANADLNGAELSNVVLAGANIRNARLTGAQLTDVNMDGVSTVINGLQGLVGMTINGVLAGDLFAAYEARI